MPFSHLEIARGIASKATTYITEDCESNQWGSFKGCLRALHGTSIRVTPSSDQKPSWEGSMHDGRVLMKAISRDGGLKVPQGGYYLVDARYCNALGFLAPFRGERKYMSFDPLEFEQAEQDEIEGEEPLGDKGYLTHINPTDEWSC
ncbi:hypothetical protein Tco_0854470 [Tanacetum coccineum]